MSRVRDVVELTCKEIVELVTDYRSHALDAADRARFEQHLFACTWCMTYLKQMERTIVIVGQLSSQNKPVDATSLAAMFRAHRHKKGDGE
jgi:hypothetical protein